MGCYTVLTLLLVALSCSARAEASDSYYKYKEGSGEVEKDDGVLVCTRTPPFKAGNGETFSVPGKKRFYVDAVNVFNWYESLANCRTRGMDLATINTRQEQDQVAKLISKLSILPKFEFWVSGTDLGTNGHFVWMSSGTPMTYTNWGQGEPVTEKDCVEVKWDLKWRTYDCSYAMFSICEYYVWNI